MKSINRTFKILEMVSSSEEGISLTELSRETNIHKSTVHRILNSLIENGYVFQRKNKKYKITFKLFKLGSTVINNNILDEASPLLTELSKETNEVVHLVVQNNSQVVYVDKKNSDYNGSIMGSSIGSTAPMYCTSVGKSLLFESNEKEIRRIWEDSLIEQKTKNTKTSLTDFIKDIEESKKRGYSLDIEENEEGIICIGAPIYNYKDDIIAAISISGPTSRFNEENIKKYSELLLKTVKEISIRLGMTITN